jgi:hypothetical protein
VALALHQVQGQEKRTLSESMILAVVAITLLGAAIVGDLLDSVGRGESSDQPNRDTT